jgi:hypothetical protein
VTDQVVRVEPGGYRPGSAHGAALGGGEPVALAGVRPLGLVVRLRYALVPAGGPEAGWEVAARAYEYLLTYVHLLPDDLPDPGFLDAIAGASGGKKVVTRRSQTTRDASSP